MKQISYDRAAAVLYARTWAMNRNPRYPNFDEMGGDCTSFASQCLYAGCEVMNFNSANGWYCNSLSSRSASWSSVEYLHQFLITNRSVGPHAEETDTDALLPGDLIQLATIDERFYHTLVVLSIENGEAFIASHTIDSLYRPLSTYTYAMKRCLHIIGARKWG